MNKTRIEHLENLNPDGQAGRLMRYAELWIGSNDKDEIRSKAEPIFLDHPEWKSKAPIFPTFDVYSIWQKFAGWPHREKLEPVLFEQWKKAGQPQDLAEKANQKYIEFTGKEIPVFPLYFKTNEHEAWERFWIAGRRYNEQIKQKITS